MSDPTGPGAVPRFASVTEFYAQALALEIEAIERYAELADQMEVHNNPEVAALFRKMAEIETKHADQIRDRAGVHLQPAVAFRWTEPEGPETTPYGEVHYLMTPYHALEIAHHNERRAHAYFAAVAAAAVDPDVRTLAEEMADEERHHVELVAAWLARYPKPGEDWADDPDPPAVIE